LGKLLERSLRSDFKLTMMTMMTMMETMMTMMESSE